MESITSTADERGPAERPAGRKRGRSTAIALGIIVGLLVGLGLILGAMIWGRQASPPPITRAELEAADRRWREHGPASYTMDIEIGGRQPGVVHIEVRNGEVLRMTRDGVTPSQPRTWVFWTVPEQFETIRQDFDSSETTGGFGAAPGAQTILKADFDSEFGFPLRYERYVLGTDLDVSWHVTRFEPAVP